MSQPKLTLAYLNEDDRVYGLAGMAISLAALNALDRVAEVSLDSDGPMVSFSHAYYFSGSPSISPKSTWDNLVQNFHITSAMVISNVLARSLVRLHSEVPTELLGEIRHQMEAEGQDTCSLEPDEIAALYDKTLRYSRRIFNNPRLHPAINAFARTLARRRIMSGMELRDELHQLQLI